MSEMDRIREVFDNWYYKGFSVTTKKNGLNGYTKTSHFNEFLKWRVFLEILNAAKPNLSEYNILDAGCGNGNTLRRLIEFGADPANCYGIDISIDALNFADSRSPGEVKYSQGFIHDIPYAAESFDVVFCLGVLIHILDDDYIRQVADEFHRVMKKDAIAIILVTDDDMNPYWGRLSHTSRNFSAEKRELEALFSNFDCLGVFESHNDTYPEDIPLSDIHHYVENKGIQMPFKTYVFKPK